MLSQPIDFSQIVGLDLETTGLDTCKDRIIQVAIAVMRGGDFMEYQTLVNPERPIPKEVQELTGITDEMVKDAPNFQSILQELIRILPTKANNKYLLAYNGIHFDVPFLWEELNRVGYNWDVDLTKIIDPGTIFKKKEGRSLSDAVLFYCNRPMVDAHNAMQDVKETFNVLQGQIHRYVDLAEMDLNQLAIFSRHSEPCDVHGKIAIDKDGDYIYNFGQKRGVKIKDDMGFGRWMLSKDFSDNTKEWLERAFQSIEEKWQRQQEEERISQEEHQRETRESQGGLF